MKVTVTDRQFALVLTAIDRSTVADREMIMSWLEDHTTRVTPLVKIQIETTAVMWARVRDICAWSLFEAKVIRRAAERAALRKALVHIASAVATREHHPALRGRLILGRDDHIIPAWWGDGWSPYPNGGIYRLLVPGTFYHPRYGQPCTTWGAQDPTLWESCPVQAVFDELVHVEHAGR